MASAGEPSNVHVAAVAALDEPTRRQLYEYVVRQSVPVSRDDAAAALGLARPTVAFHLDRLVKDGLLEVVRERRSGRSGPGAGRPSKLYLRSSREFAVSLPERRYDMAGQLLASAVQEAERTGSSPKAVLDQRAREFGQRLGEAARAEEGASGSVEVVVRVLDDNGFEPRVSGADVLLNNCPFHSLAKEHTELVCGMNLCLLTGLLDGLETGGLTARLEPAADHCCVRIAVDDDRTGSLKRE